MSTSKRRGIVEVDGFTFGQHELNYARVNWNLLRRGAEHNRIRIGYMLGAFLFGLVLYLTAYGIGDGTVVMPKGWHAALIRDFLNNLGIVLWTSVILTVFLDVYVDEVEKQSVARLKALQKALASQGHQMEPIEIKDDAATAEKLDSLLAKIDALQAEVAALRGGE